MGSIKPNHLNISLDRRLQAELKRIAFERSLPLYQLVEEILTDFVNNENGSETE